jgi:hypothetical protein
MKLRKCGQKINLGGVVAEETDRFHARLVQRIVDVVREVVADGCGRNGEPGRPLGDEVFDVGYAVNAGLIEIVDELRR